jgi:hypothetical protein
LEVVLAVPIVVQILSPQPYDVVLVGALPNDNPRGKRRRADAGAGLVLKIAVGAAVHVDEALISRMLGVAESRRQADIGSRLVGRTTRAEFSVWVTRDGAAIAFIAVEEIALACLSTHGIGQEHEAEERAK